MFFSFVNNNRSRYECTKGLLWLLLCKKKMKTTTIDNVVQHFSSLSLVISLPAKRVTNTCHLSPFGNERLKRITIVFNMPSYSFSIHLFLAHKSFLFHLKTFHWHCCCFSFTPVKNEHDLTRWTITRKKTTNRKSVTNGIEWIRKRSNVFSLHQQYPF